MRDRRRKLAAPVLLALCLAAQSVTVFAAEDAQVQTVGRMETGESEEALHAESAADGLRIKAADGGGQDAAESADSRAADGSGQEPGGTQNPDDPQNPGGAQNPDGGQEPGNPDNPGDPQNPDEPGNPDNPDDPAELPVPGKPAGLRTTRQSATKVLLAWYEDDDADIYEVYRKTGSGSYKKLAQVDEARYVDRTVQDKKTYRYRVVALNAEGAAGEAAEIDFFNQQVVSIKKQKYTYKAMQADMKQLAKTYADYCELISIGKSVEGRDIYDFAIGNPDASRSLLVVGTLHAREYICSATLMRQIEYYLQNYNKSIGGIKPASLLKDMQVHYIVMANPDGVTISQTGYPRWKSNSRGVDLNRNFPAKKFHVGGKKGAEGYSGKYALSEPETRAVSAYTVNLKYNQGLRGVVNYHAMGQIIYGDCPIKKLKKNTQKMYGIASKLTGYKSAGNNTFDAGKSIGGQYREYVMGMLDLPSITIEVGATWAPCAYREYNSVFQKNKLVVLKIAEVF